MARVISTDLDLLPTEDLIGKRVRYEERVDGRSTWVPSTTWATVYSFGEYQLRRPVGGAWLVDHSEGDQSYPSLIDPQDVLRIESAATWHQWDGAHYLYIHPGGGSVRTPRPAPTCHVTVTRHQSTSGPPSVASWLSTTGAYVSVGGPEGQDFVGSIARIVVRENNLDGRILCDTAIDQDVDTSTDPDAGQSSWVGSTGETWTVQRSTATGVVMVTRPVLLWSSVNRMLAPLDNPYLVQRDHAVSAAITTVQADPRQELSPRELFAVRDWAEHDITADELVAFTEHMRNLHLRSRELPDVLPLELRRLDVIEPDGFTLAVLSPTWLHPDLQYQWQHLVGTSWIDLEGETGRVLQREETAAVPGAGTTRYRAAVTYGDLVIHSEIADVKVWSRGHTYPLTYPRAYNL